MNPSFSRLATKAPYAIFVCALAGAALFAAVAAALPSRVKVSMAFTVAQQARQETAEYSYDGYYALRASELVADTLLSWLSTPAIVKEVYQKAGISMTDEEIAGLAGRAFRGKKFSSQNVVVSYAASDAATARKLYDALAASLPARARSLVLSPEQETLFVVTASEPVIAASKTSSGRAALSGAFVGAFIGIAFAYAASRKTA